MGLADMSEQLSMDETWVDNIRNESQARFKHTKFPWTEQNVERLKILVREGKTGSQIGKELGCTRNAVIGKIYRLGLKGPPQKPKQRASKLHPNRKYKPYTRKLKMVFDNHKPATIEVVPLNIPFLQIKDGQCRFICGEPDGVKTLYCGRPVMGECSYCLGHFIATHDLTPRQEKMRKAA